MWRAFESFQDHRSYERTRHLHRFDVLSIYLLHFWPVCAACCRRYHLRGVQIKEHFESLGGDSIEPLICIYLRMIEADRMVR